MADFAVEVTRWVEGRAKPAANAAFRAIATAAVNRVKELTPVDTGFLRSNWTAVRPNEPIPVAGRVPDPAYTIASAKIGDVLIILNPTVYARRIEYGFTGEDKTGRVYSQNGAHMVAQTVAEMPAIAARAIATLRGG